MFNCACRFVPGNTMAAVFGELWRRIGQPKGASTIRHVTHRAFPQICQVSSKDRNLLLVLQIRTVHSTSKAS